MAEFVALLGFMVICVVVAPLLGLIPASIASRKGYSFGFWWLYGTLLFIAALPHAILMSRNAEGVEQQQRVEGLRKCPFCAEMIKSEAIVCRYCGRDIQPATPSSS